VFLRVHENLLVSLCCKYCLSVFLHSLSLCFHVSVSMSFMPFCLSFFFSFCLHQNILASLSDKITLSLCLSVYQSFCFWFLCLSVFGFFVFLFLVSLSFSLYISLKYLIGFCLSVCLFVSLSLYVSLPPSYYLFICFHCFHCCNFFVKY
jgi:hypothetical protein